jgi:multidrug efflux system membrane fusion protein
MCTKATVTRIFQKGYLLMIPVTQEESVDLQQPSELSRHKPRKHWWWFILLLLLLGAAYLFRTSHRSRANDLSKRANLQEVLVTTVIAKKGDIPVIFNGLGTVTPYNTVTIKTRVDGQLVKIAFQEGQLVREGQLLAEVDPRPFEVQLEQAEGQQARDLAQLNNAKIDLARYQVLIKEDSIAQQQVDTQAATVTQLEGAVKSDQAAIDNAKLQLIYCHISAPISGRIGLRQVDVGNMIHTADANGIAVITQVQPIAVLFTLPEDNLPPVLSKLRAGNNLPVEAYDRSGATKITSGILSTVDNQIDPTTGTLRLKAVFKNEDDTLFPDQFVNIKLLTDTKKNVVIVPVAAIQRGPQGTFLYVVNKNKTVEVRPITAGVSDGNYSSIDKGLRDGEAVVVDGTDKLREGSKVRDQKSQPTRRHQQ